MTRLLHRAVTAWLRRFLLRRVPHGLQLYGRLDYKAHPEPRDLWVGLHWNFSPYWANAYVCLRPGYVHHWRWPVVLFKRGAEGEP